MTLPETIPNSLEEAVELLEARLDPEAWAVIASASTMAIFHMSLGLGIRNAWDLHGTSRLALWFQERDVSDADTMSGLILEMLQKRIKGEPVG